MRITNFQTDQTVLRELGERIARRRIRRSLTQAQLAREAGIGKRTLERFENGSSIQLSGLIRILRVLELLPALDLAVADPELSPVDLAKRRGKQRKRASSRKSRVERDSWEWKDKV